jgi:hypothetical protein
MTLHKPSDRRWKPASLLEQRGTADRWPGTSLRASQDSEDAETAERAYASLCGARAGLGLHPSFRSQVVPLHKSPGACTRIDDERVAGAGQSGTGWKLLSAARNQGRERAAVCGVWGKPDFRLANIAAAAMTTAA